MGNLLQFLCDELTRVEAQTQGIPQLIEHGMASRLLALIFGYEWYSRRIKFCSEDPDEWMQNGDDGWLAANPIENDVRRIVHAHRVIRLADALFTLFSSRVEGLDVLKNRFLTRPTKPCFIEAEVASLLVCNGFQIQIIKESGLRGEDFDLLATKDAKTVSVEVTSKLDGPLTIKTISNTLHSKRNQVPADRPAVLYMHIPSEWMRAQPIGLAVFTDAIVGFLNRSKRFNAIVLLWEEILPFLSGGFPTFSLRACFNERPRHPFESRHLFEVHPFPDGRMRMARSFLESVKEMRVKHQTESQLH
jgi:hypothetical protein